LRSSIDLAEYLLQPIAFAGQRDFGDRAGTGGDHQEDTTEYRADAYKVTRDAMAQDLIDKLRQSRSRTAKCIGRAKKSKKFCSMGVVFWR
jgi:hypothetical protein